MPSWAFLPTTPSVTDEDSKEAADIEACLHSLPDRLLSAVRANDALLLDQTLQECKEATACAHNFCARLECSPSQFDVPLLNQAYAQAQARLDELGTPDHTNAEEKANELLATGSFQLLRRCVPPVLAPHMPWSPGVQYITGIAQGEADHQVMFWDRIPILAATAFRASCWGMLLCAKVGGDNQDVASSWASFTRSLPVAGVAVVHHCAAAIAGVPGLIATTIVHPLSVAANTRLVSASSVPWTTTLRDVLGSSRQYAGFDAQLLASVGPLLSSHWQHAAAVAHHILSWPQQFVMSGVTDTNLSSSAFLDSRYRVGLRDMVTLGQRHLLQCSV